MASTCDHPIQAGGMCAICGMVLSDDQTSGSISMMHDTESVTVSRQEARRLDTESTKHLLDQRKLALIVDLDQTIIHATVDPTVGEWLRNPENPNYEALKGVGSFRLGMDGKAILDASKDPKQQGSSSSSADDNEGCWYYVKPRPGLHEFLHKLSEKYELHVYTMGTRSYADCVCKLVDPDGALFGTRILSRDENGSLVQKSLSRLFPMDTSMVVIIDDRGDVWQWSPNLIKVIPYDFFVGSGDINAGFLPAQTGPGTSTPATAAATPLESSSASSSSSSATPDSAPVSSPDAGSVASSSSDTTAPSEAADSSSPQPPPPPPPAKDTRSPTDKLNDAAEKEEARAAEREVKVKAEQSQKSIVSEQLDARPLARMQEQLDEKFGITSSNRSTPASEGVSPASESSATPVKDETPSSAAAEVAPATNGTTHQNQYETSPPAPPPPAPSDSDAPPPQAPAHALLRDTDRELDRVKEILDEIHTTWFSRWDEYIKVYPGATTSSQPSDPDSSTASSSTGPVKPTVMAIISELKKRVLSDCDIVFSSLIPLSGRLDDSEYFWMAIEYGATCAPELKAETTHLVAAKVGTAKVQAAQRQQGTQVVWPSWLHDSIAHWHKMPEEPYALPPCIGNGDDIVSSAHPTDDDLSSDDLDFAMDGDDDTTAGSQEALETGGDKGVGSSTGPSNGQGAPSSSAPAGGGNAPSSGSQDCWALDAVGWAEADKELQDFLDGSEGDDEAGEDEGGSVFFGDDDEDDGQVDGTNTPSGRRRRPAGKRSRRSTPSVNGDGLGESSQSIRLVEDPPSSSASDGGNKRRRMVATATKQPDGTYRATGDVSTQVVDGAGETSSAKAKSPRKQPPPPGQPRSHTNSVDSSASDGAADGDDTQAFMEDLEHELEAAMDDGEDD